MVRRTGIVLGALLLLAAGTARGASSEANGPADQLAASYRRAKDPDVRFWIVDALHRRLREDKDERALGPLLEAAKDPQADVRRRAFAALESAGELPAEARGRWRERLADAAASGSKDKTPRVREAAEGFAGSLGRAPAPPPAAEGEEAPGADRRRAARAAVLWVLCLQLAAWAWSRLAGSVLRQAGEAGAAGSARLAAVVDRSDYLVFPVLSAAALLAVVGLGLASVLTRALAPGEGGLGAFAWLRFFFWMYVVCGLAVFVPSAALARRAARGAMQAGAFRAALGALRDLPGALALGALALSVAPWGGIYRRLARRPPDSPWRWLAATGAFFGGWVAASRAAREPDGWLAGLHAAAKGGVPAAASPWLARPLAQAPLVALFCSAPLFFAASQVLAGRLGAGASRLFDLWFVSDAGFAGAFGVWAGALAVSVFAAFWSCAAALEAAEAAAQGRALRHAEPGSRPQAAR